MINIPNLEHLPAEILVGIANEHLRHNCKDRQSLFYDLDIPSTVLEQKLSDSGFEYDILANQYRSIK